MKAVRSLFYLLVGFLLAVNATLAFSTTPAEWTWGQTISATKPCYYGGGTISMCTLGQVQSFVNDHYSRNPYRGGTVNYSAYSGGDIPYSWSAEYYNGISWSARTGNGTLRRVKKRDACPEGYVRNQDTSQCEAPTPTCTAGEMQDYGIFPVPSGGGVACYGTCAVTHSSIPEGDGYRWTGTVTGQCSPVEQPETCTESSSNFLGYVNDKPFCADQGETPTPDPDPEPDPGDTGGDTGGGDTGGGDTGGGDTGGGDTGGGNTGGGNTGGGSGTGDGSGSGDDSGEGDDGDGEVPAFGFPERVTFYEPKYPETLTKLVKDKIDQVKEAPIVGLIDSLTSGAPSSGSCPSWSFSFKLGAAGNYGSMSVAPPCWLWTAIETILIITTLFAARRIIFGG